MTTDTSQRVAGPEGLPHDSDINALAESGTGDQAAESREVVSGPVPLSEVQRLSGHLTKIADASRRDDGTDIPLGEQCREAANLIWRLWDDWHLEMENAASLRIVFNAVAHSARKDIEFLIAERDALRQQVADLTAALAEKEAQS